nr:sulfurtransferase TusA family protein [Oscillatoria sp. HE19RPO]
MTQNLTSESDYPTLDLRGTPCPMNFVRTKLRLDKMNPGEVLEVWLDPGEPIEQVPDSLVMDGHSMELIEDRGGFFAIQVRRAPKSA